MQVDWRRFCRAKDFLVTADTVTVSLPDERRHRVHVEEADDALRLTAIVVGASVGDTIENLPIRTWRRNRGTELIGFGIDQKRRLIGWCWVTKAGMSEAEFQLYVRTLASECDRYKYELTGEDA